MNEDLEHRDLARRLLSMIEHALASGLSLPLYMVLVSVDESLSKSSSSTSATLPWVRGISFIPLRPLSQWVVF
jgi:hypothetical protein